MTIKPIGVLDIAKFCLAIMIVSLHTGLLADSPFCWLLWPWVRIAVPLFFVISAYLFFLRYDDRWVSVWHACKRILLLYCFWTVLLLIPIVFLRKSAFQGGGWLEFGWHFFRCILRGATFQGGWFLIALLLSLCISCGLLKLFRNAALVWAVAGVSFVLSTAKSSGCFGLADIELVRRLGDEYVQIYGGQPFLGFPIAFVYIMIGRRFALLTREQRKMDFRWPRLLVAFVALAVFWMEWYYLKERTESFNYDSYLSLPLVASAIFACLRTVDLELSAARFLRDASIVIYVTHGVIGPFFGMLWERMLHLPGCFAIPRFVAALAIGLLVTVVVRHLRFRCGFELMKYAC